MAASFLEELLVVRNAVFAVDEAVVGILLAIVSPGKMRPFLDHPVSPITPPYTLGAGRMIWSGAGGE
jgi:hypothetical protein